MLRNKDNIAPALKPVIVQQVEVAMRKAGEIDPYAASSTGIIKNPSRY